MKYLIKAISILLILFIPFFAYAGNGMKKLIDEMLDFSVNQSMSMFKTLENRDGLLPRTAKDGELVTCTAGWWTSGFFPGTLWYCYEYSRNDAVRNAAEIMTARVEEQKHTTNNHDVGFIINCSFGNGYRLTHREDYRTVLTTAAHSLSTRFNSEVECIKSWNGKSWQFPVIIDNMMNLELLTVGSSLTGELLFYNMAKSHADLTLVNHYRHDYSSFHVVDYDSISGKVIRQATNQGFSDSSAWSRGQAWGLYGFTMMYRQTGKQEFLDHAVKIGEFIMNHPNMPKDKIPYWDYDAPNIPKEDRDASAAAIMASAYIELSTYVGGELKGQFLDLAAQQIRSLSSEAYRAKKVGQNNNFIIKNCTGFMSKQYEIKSPLSYADYYYVEALIRYNNLLECRPVVEVLTAFSENPERSLWLSSLHRIVEPILRNMADSKLKDNMPVESRNINLEGRRKVTHLEALGRVLTGISPWLELGPDTTIEGRLREKYIDWAVKSITHAVNPYSSDYLNFNSGGQALVDAAFFAHALLRAPTQLWNKLDKITQKRVISELKSSRVIPSRENNWLLFPAMIEMTIKEYSGEWEYDRIAYAIDRFDQWYKGDGWYGDGNEFHLDYYNSLVIHPMMFEILSRLSKYHKKESIFYEIERKRYSRFAEQQEKFISPEGTYPIIGRSMAYRFGIFHALSDAAYRNLLPTSVEPAQVRNALSCVIKRQINVLGTFNPYGWLRVGFAGYQPSIGEDYISTGSLYLCSAVFIALGLSPNDNFWDSPSENWTSNKGWNGLYIEMDKMLREGISR